MTKLRHVRVYILDRYMTRMRHDRVHILDTYVSKLNSHDKSTYSSLYGCIDYVMQSFDGLYARSACLHEGEILSP